MDDGNSHSSFCLFGLVLVLSFQHMATTASAQENQNALARRPNILWLSSEDHGPHLGCYGDKFATPPNVDRLASKGTVYLHCWSCAPVCAPARTTIISGLYPPATGSEHMRSLVPYPAGKQMFPQFLRGAGYYCSNNSKEDYNLAKPSDFNFAQPGKVWDDSSRKAHWRGRQPGQPFFAVFNSEKSHESKVRARPHKAIHDPAKVRVPAYHPDTPEVRQDWAQYYDVVSEADADAGARLKELEQDGLAEDTIVWYWADHGSGMPRNKRSPCNSGLHVPLIVYIPPKFRELATPDATPGGRSERLVSFVDFAPTMLSLAGIEPPEWMHGHAFLGRFATAPQPFVYGFRGRMDERYDMVRSATDGRYVYVRNYMPHLIYGQHVDYMFQTPTTVVWKNLHDEGKLTTIQDQFWNTKPPEELYDLQNDPDEVHNLAVLPAHKEILQTLRQAQQDLARRIRDVGFLPEGELFSRSPGVSPYDLPEDRVNFSFERIFATAELASLLAPEAVPELKQALDDSDSAVRYWAALGLLMRGQPAYASAETEIGLALTDRSPYVRIVAAQMLAQYGPAGRLPSLQSMLVEMSDPTKTDIFVAVSALTALESLGDKIKPAAAAIQALPANGKLPDARYEPYVPRLLQNLRAKL